MVLPELVAAFLYPWDKDKDEDYLSFPDVDAGNTGENDIYHNLMGLPHNPVGTVSESSHVSAASGRMGTLPPW